MKGVLAVWRPTFGAHTLQELNRPSVGSLLVDTLHHLVADRTRVITVHGEGEITEVDLGVQVVAACARNTQAAVGHGHVVQVGAKTLVPPGTDRMATGLVKVGLGVKDVVPGIVRKKMQQNLITSVNRHIAHSCFC